MKIEQILVDNDYLLDFIHKHVKNRFNNIRFKKVGKQDSKNICSLFFKQSLRILLPSNNSNVSKLISNIFKLYNMHPIPIVEIDLKSIVKLGKDSTSKWGESNVVYRLKCENCL